MVLGLELVLGRGFQPKVCNVILCNLLAHYQGQIQKFLKEGAQKI